MNDEQMRPLLEVWLRDRQIPPPRAQAGVAKVMANVPRTRQQGRWWPLPALRRKVPTRTGTDTTDYRPTPIPAADGHSPTVIGRTQIMLSPVKAITAGVIVFALGGVMLIAQPFGQQAGVAPGAESADFVEPVEFTAVLTKGPWVSQPTCEFIGGDMMQCQGEAWTPDITEVSDPRLDGEVTLSVNTNKWPGQPNLANLTYRITNEDGSWQGSFPSIYEGKAAPVTAGVVLVGEGDYEGLYAWMDASDWSAVSGVVFSYPPPEAPAPPSAD